MVLPMQKEVLQQGLKQLQLIGLWGERPRPVYRYFAILAFELVFLFVPKIVLGPGKEGFDSFARNIAELIFVGEVVISIGLFNARGLAFAKLVTILRDVVERFEAKPNADEIRASLRKTRAFFKTYMKYFWAMVTGYVTLPVISTTVALLTKSPSGRGEFMLTIVMDLYWLDIRHNPIHYGIYSVVIILCTICSAYQSMLKITVISGSIQYCTKLFEFTTERINRLGEFAEEQLRRQELREILQIHQSALEYAVHLESCVSFFLLNQVSCCVLILCLFMYYISTSFGPNAINVMILFIILMGEMGFFCFNGDTLSDKAAKVGHAMYNYPWYLEPVDMQKDMKLIIARSQRPTGITAAKFYFVNRERFAIVIQASYSYYLMLKNTF